MLRWFVVFINLVVFVFLYRWPVYPWDISTIPQYYEHAQRMLLGQQPYRDFVFEYPPLAIPLLFLPIIGAPEGDVFRYKLFYAIEQAALGVGLAVLGLMFLERYQRTPNYLAVLVAQPLFFLAAGVMVTLERYDFAPALMTLAALYLWPQQHGLLSWPLLAIGTALKVYPALLAPLFALEHLRRGEWRVLGRNMALFGATVALAFLPSLTVGSDALAVPLTYHSDRGIEINSLWATPLLWWYTQGGSLEVVQAFSSEEVHAPGSQLFARLAVPAILVLLAWVYWRYWRRLSPGAAPTTATVQDDKVEGSQARLVRYSALVILAFIVPNKVLSPQYFVWLIPFIPLLVGRSRWLIMALFAIILGLSQYIYPHHWVELTTFLDRWTILAVMARNVLLIPLFILLLEE